MRGYTTPSSGGAVDDKALTKILKESNLSLGRVEEWLVIQRVKFDIHVDEVPYHSLHVYANLGTRKCTVRVWGRTVWSGEVETLEDLATLCADYFEGKVVCIGHLGSRPGALQEFVPVDYPCTRWVARACTVTYAKTEADGAVGICSACSNTNRDIDEFNCALKYISAIT